MKKHLFFLITIAILFSTACQNNQENNQSMATRTQGDSTEKETGSTIAKGIIGKWVQPIPGQEGQQQGVQLNSDGSASSINIHTLIYEKWQLKGDTLLLTYHTQGVRTTGSDVDTVLLHNLTDSTLTLAKKSGFKMNYTRGK